MSAASFDVSDSSDVSGANRTLGSAAYRDEDFPVSESVPQPASRLDHYEGCLEFWDAATETAWRVCELNPIQHEPPSRRLAQMADRVASLRGSAIECFGSADLVRVDAQNPVRANRSHGGATGFVSFCPALDVYSQGPSEEAAIENLAEALQLFVESCLARGTLDRVLKDCGFEPEAAKPEPVEDLYMAHVPLSLVVHEPARAG